MAVIAAMVEALMEAVTAVVDTATVDTAAVDTAAVDTVAVVVMMGDHHLIGTRDITLHLHRNNNSHNPIKGIILHRH